MKFEKAFSALREGKEIRHKGCHLTIGKFFGDEIMFIERPSKYITRTYPISSFHPTFIPKLFDNKWEIVEEVPPKRTSISKYFRRLFTRHKKT